MATVVVEARAEDIVSTRSNPAVALQRRHGHCRPPLRLASPTRRARHLQLIAQSFVDRQLPRWLELHAQTSAVEPAQHLGEERAAVCRDVHAIYLSNASPGVSFILWEDAEQHQIAVLVLARSRFGEVVEGVGEARNNLLRNVLFTSLRRPGHVAPPPAQRMSSDSASSKLPTSLATLHQEPPYSNQSYSWILLAISACFTRSFSWIRMLSR